MFPKKCNNVFTYGSLMFNDVWKRVVRGNYKEVGCVLHGYARKAVRNEEYPAVIKARPESSVNGIVYKDVTIEDILRLDDFEGEYYLREKGQVVLSGNRCLPVIFYLLKPEFNHILSDQDWDEELFRRKGIQRFLRKYCGFGKV